ncbi:YgjV family protein [Serratia symbiotica]
MTLMQIIDILGYIGTALVVLSFLCSSIVKLRILNAIGASFVTLYAALTHAWPIVLLDGFIVIANIYQLQKLRKNKRGM